MTVRTSGIRLVAREDVGMHEKQHARGSKTRCDSILKYKQNTETRHLDTSLKIDETANCVCNKLKEVLHL